MKALKKTDGERVKQALTKGGVIQRREAQLMMDFMHDEKLKQTRRSRTPQGTFEEPVYDGERPKRTISPSQNETPIKD